MSKRSVWLTIGAVAVVCFVAGLVVAQEGWRYPYLPDEYSEPYTPTLAEWRALRMTARMNNEEHLTARLVKRSLRAFVLGSHLDLVVDTDTQPGWDTHLGKGRFSCSDREIRAAYEEAAVVGQFSIMKAVRRYFPGISDENVKILFGIRGSGVGTWQGGKMTLEGEE